jgi:hypothetical protein
MDLNFGLVNLPSAVTGQLGAISTFLVSALNIFAVAIVIMVAYRFAMISVGAVAEFRTNPTDNGMGILRGAFASILAAFMAGILAWVLVTMGTPALLGYAMQGSASLSNDAILQASGSQVNAFFVKVPVLATVFNAIQGIAKIAIIVIGGVLLAKTGYDGIKDVQSSGGGNAKGGNAFASVRNAGQRALIIAILTVLGYAMIAVGPDLLFGYLRQFGNTLTFPTTG